MKKLQKALSVALLAIVSCNASALSLAEFSHTSPADMTNIMSQEIQGSSLEKKVLEAVEEKDFQYLTSVKDPNLMFQYLTLKEMRLNNMLLSMQHRSQMTQIVQATESLKALEEIKRELQQLSRRG